MMIGIEKSRRCYLSQWSGHPKPLESWDQALYLEITKRMQIKGEI